MSSSTIPKDKKILYNCFFTEQSKGKERGRGRERKGVREGGREREGRREGEREREREGGGGGREEGCDSVGRGCISIFHFIVSVTVT